MHCSAGDGIVSVVFGVLRGCGRQRLGAIANLTIIWGLGMPLAGILTFKLGMGILGLWLDQLGISVATSQGCGAASCST